MPTLENERHELFAQHLAQGKTATEAYSLAGFRAHRGNAARLRADECVRARVLEIQAASASSAEINIASICRELDAAIQVAQGKGQANAMVSAAGLRAKLAGLLTDKIEVTNITATPMNASPDEILQAFWHSCTIGCPDVEITEEDRTVLAAVLKVLRAMEDDMIARSMAHTIEQDRIARVAMSKATPAEVEYRRMRSDRERLFNGGLFNNKGRPQGLLRTSDC